MCCCCCFKIGHSFKLAKLLLPDLWLNFTEVNKHDNPISTGETFAKLVWHHSGHYLLHLPEASRLHVLNLPFLTASATQNDAGSVSLLLSNNFRECENEDNYEITWIMSLGERNSRLLLYSFILATIF